MSSGEQRLIASIADTSQNSAPCGPLRTSRRHPTFSEGPFRPRYPSFPVENARTRADVRFGGARAAAAPRRRPAVPRRVALRAVRAPAQGAQGPPGGAGGVLRGAGGLVRRHARGAAEGPRGDAGEGRGGGAPPPRFGGGAHDDLDRPRRRHGVQRRGHGRGIGKGAPGAAPCRRVRESLFGRPDAVAVRRGAGAVRQAGLGQRRGRVRRRDGVAAGRVGRPGARGARDLQLLALDDALAIPRRRPRPLPPPPARHPRRRRLLHLPPGRAHGAPRPPPQDQLGRAELLDLLVRIRRHPPRPRTPAVPRTPPPPLLLALLQERLDVPWLRADPVLRVPQLASRGAAPPRGRAGTAGGEGRGEEEGEEGERGEYGERGERGERKERRVCRGGDIEARSC